MKLNSSKYKSGEKALSRKEYEKLISVIDNFGDELLIKLAVSTGIRREDVCNIKIKNINFEDGILLFHESKKDKTDKVTKEVTECWRSIYLDTSIVSLIKKYLNTQGRREKLFPFSGRTAYRNLNHWCRIAEIPERPFHSLRATCYKFCQEAGWGTERAAKHIGDSVRVAQEHYATPSEGEMREAVRERPII